MPISLFSEAREEVLANLANFAYDPINYEWLRKLKIIDIFLNQLSEGTPTLCSFAVSGLCNLSLDQENKSYIIKNDGVALIRGCLSSPEESTVISAIVTLMFLVTPQSKAVVGNCFGTPRKSHTIQGDPDPYSNNTSLGFTSTVEYFLSRVISAQL
ncbi:Armadillo repeat-containing protein 7-like [Homarus americanus]|uniref:Armadillo repeat-containing protein 7-like n=1 Tax=Homarus americanus TaxID=6706 RepID=A0A8J5JTA0_HOMAM|nr:Armadillo repeat-containing protein 7-like [Homarus americanus]